MESPNLQIIEVNEHELELLQRISRLTFFETFANQNTPENMHLYMNECLSLEKIREEFHQSHSSFYFIKVNNNVAGYFKISFSNQHGETPLEKTLEIERLYLLKPAQGTGIGQKTMQQIKEIATANAVSTLWLGVWENNRSAIQFYEKSGFSVFGEHIFKLGNDNQRDLLMKIKI